MTPYFSEYPTVKQAAFLLTGPIEEVFYGGAGGGGKSSALLMAALQYVDVPGYSALILRKTFTDLSLPGALIDRSHEWLDGTPAKWDDRTHTWSFPTRDPNRPAKIAFGYLDYELAFHRYRSAEFQFIGFDELTEFTLSDSEEETNSYLFLRSRLRRRSTMAEIPLRIRSASNPGGPGHEFVKRRFVKQDPAETGRMFIPAKVDDNPHIDREAYIRTLLGLPPIWRERILNGDWDITGAGKVINRMWFERIISKRPPALVRVRAWDLAASAKGKRTAGVLMSRMGPLQRPWEYTIEHCLAGHWTPGSRDEMIKKQAQIDGKDVFVVIEQEPGSGGLAQVYNLKKYLAGYMVYEIKTPAERAEKFSHLAAKVRRAGPFATQAEIGNVAIVQGDWNDEYLDELDNFPDGVYSDRIDATSHAFNWLSEREFHHIDDDEDPARGRLCECGHDPHEPWCETAIEEKEQAYREYNQRRMEDFGPKGRP